MSKILPWHEIDTVLLDMDGTLLDLHFDNFFWQGALVEAYAQDNNISWQAANEYMEEWYAQKHGSLDWYNIDYWQDYLQLDIMALKQQHSHLIRYRDSAEDFLKFLQKKNKTAVLVTNAHPKSLSLKLQHCDLGNYIPHLFSTHDFGYAKEEENFWPSFCQHFPFDKERSLFIDDNESVLRSARQFGIKHLLCVSQPDSRHPEKASTLFTPLQKFHDIM